MRERHSFVLPQLKSAKEKKEAKQIGGKKVFFGCEAHRRAVDVQGVKGEQSVTERIGGLGPVRQQGGFLDFLRKQIRIIGFENRAFLPTQIKNRLIPSVEDGNQSVPEFSQGLPFFRCEEQRGFSGHCSYRRLFGIRRISAVHQRHSGLGSS
ncbi:MAG: hypothetical protein ACLFSZ_00310 [Puniceicoccaceae bacterium]